MMSFVGLSLVSMTYRPENRAQREEPDKGRKEICNCQPGRSILSLSYQSELSFLFWEAFKELFANSLATVNSARTELI